MEGGPFIGPPYLYRVRKTKISNLRKHDVKFFTIQ